MIRSSPVAAQRYRFWMPVRRANANHRTVCVGRTMGLRSEESSSMGRASDSESDGRGFDSLLFHHGKALKRLAVRLRLFVAVPREPPRRAVACPALRRRDDCWPATPARSRATGNRAKAMIGQPSATPASKDAGRRARPAGQRPGIDPSSAARAWGVLPTLATLFINQAAGAGLDGILTLGGGGPETAPTATRHARPPDCGGTGRMHTTSQGEPRCWVTSGP